MPASAPPLVSIITPPTFNRERTITQAVESVLAQSYSHWELIIVDDGSRDSTREKLASYLDDERIHYHFQENQGQSIARNLALQYARGELLCFLDSDDLWVPEKLEKQVALMEAHPKVDVLHSDEIMIDEQGRELSRKNMRRYSGRIARQMLVDNSVSINTVMARRKCFDAMGGFSGRYGVADDYDIWLRFSARFTFLYVPEYWGGYYRVMADQISSDKKRRFAANEAIIRDFIGGNTEVHSNPVTSAGGVWPASTAGKPVILHQQETRRRPGGARLLRRCGMLRWIPWYGAPFIG